MEPINTEDNGTLDLQAMSPGGVFTVADMGLKIPQMFHRKENQIISN